jgi:phage-related minor tail protein
LAAKKIGALITLDGEKEFNQNVTSCNKTLSSLKSEMGLVKAQCEGQQNSLESLTKKHEVLTKILEEQKRKEEEVRKGLEHAKQNYEKVADGLSVLNKEQDTHTKRVEELKVEYKTATDRLEEMTKAGDASEDAMKAQEEAVNALSQELEKEEAALKEVNAAISKGEQNYKTAGNKIRDWETKLNTAEAQTIRASAALNKNAAYMDEARNSTDQCASSIDEFGKEVKKAEAVTVDFGTVVKTNLVNSMVNVVKDTAVSAAQSMMSLETAQKQFQASTGATTEEMRNYKSVMDDLHRNNYGEDINDVAQSMALVRQYTGELDASKIRDMTENGLAMRDVFGMDLGETIKGVDSMMDNMGVTSEEAFDLMAKGAQRGLDKSGELAENIAEYGPLWSQAGFSAKEMFAILENGLDSGAYNLDKVNDFVKEFGNSLADGRIEENLGSFSEQTKSLFYQWKSGQATTKDVFRSVINDLATAANKQEMLTLASNTWSALGEDNAMKVITSLNQVNTTFDNVKGTMEEIKKVRYDTLEARFQTLGKKFQTDVAVPIAEKALPAMEEGLDLVVDHMDELIPVMGGVAAGAVAFKTVSAAVALYTTTTEGATAATTIFNTVANANPLVLVATAVAAAGTALAIYTDSVSEASAEAQVLAEANHKICDSANEVAASTKELISDYGNTTAEMQAQGEYARILAEKIEVLSQTADRSNEKTQVMQGYIAELNTLVPELNLAYDEQSKSLNLTNEAIEEYLTNSQKQIEMQAAQEYAVELIKKKTELEIEGIKIENEAADLKEKTNALLEEENERAGGVASTYALLNGLNRDQKKTYKELTEAQEENTEALETNRTTKEELQAQIEAASQQLEQYGIKWSDVTAATDANTESTNTNAAAQTAAADVNSAAVQNITETYLGMQETVSEVLASQMNMFEEFNAGTEISSEKLLANMQSQIEGVTNWADNMAVLAERGVNQGILDKLAEMGPQGSSYVQAFAGMTDEQLKQANEMWSQSLDMKDAVNESVQGMIEEYTNSLNGGKEQVAAAMESLGVDISTGLGNGIRSAMDQGKIAADDMGKVVILQARTTFDSHSPSRVFEGIGQDVVSGLADGIGGSQEQATTAIQALADQMIDSTKQVLNASDFSGIGREVGSGLQNGIQSQKNAVVSTISSVGRSVRDKAKEELREDKFKTIGSAVSKGLASGIKGGQSSVRSAANSVTQAVISEGRKLGTNTLYSAGFNVSMGLANGISAGRSAVINSVASLCASAVTTANSKLEINSPSKVFMRIGAGTAEGFEMGYEKKMGEVNRVIRDSMDYSGYMGTAGSVGTGAAGTFEGTDIIQMLQKYLPYLANVGNGEVYLYPSRRTFRKEITEIANEGIGMRNVMERMR